MTTGLVLGSGGKNGASLSDAMTSTSKLEWNLLLGAFAMAVREGRFTKNCTDTLVEGTVRSAISHVVQAFRESGRQNPTKDADNMLSVLLSRQFRAYRNDDPKEVQQKPYLSLFLKN